MTEPSPSSDPFLSSYDPFQHPLVWCLQDFLQLALAQRRVELARTTYERERQLWQEQISAEQDLLQARQALQEAEIALNNARQKTISHTSLSTRLRTMMPPRLQHRPAPSISRTPRERLGNGTIKVWSTTQRFGGQL